jgi:hypothetical protein
MAERRARERVSAPEGLRPKNYMDAERAALAHDAIQQDGCPL